mmetsp:Transcript_3795/g.7259  ORF Transcript_3795/g.7259 Transcript_3795/m.7259 type:complete len:552 (+) Transcript_3795:212-1867(+)
MNNQQVHKRASRAIPNGNADLTTTTSTVHKTSQRPKSTLSTHDDSDSRHTDDETVKRLRRLRRKTKTNQAQQKRALLLEAILGTAFLMIMVLLVLQSLQENDHERGNDRLASKLMRLNRKNQMRVDLDNPQIMTDDPNGSGGGGGLGGGLFNLRHHLLKVIQYKHSDYMQYVGDHSIAYSKLRKEYDALLPFGDEKSLERIKRFVANLRKNEYKNAMQHDMPYDVHNCPMHPPPNYPYAWNVKEVLDNWAPDDPNPREYIYQGLCVFDYETEREKAMKYREAELPFVIRDDPRVLRTVERWAQDGYLQRLLGENTRYRTEYSPNNHFMYWMRPKKKNMQDHTVPDDWKPPTEMTRMPFSEWLHHANVTDDKLGPDMEHWYFRLIGCGEMGRNCDKDSSEYLFDELPFFQPRDGNPLYMPEPRRQKGIHCRFGMKGVIAENHFDGSRNSIALLGGERRYILAHPDQCENMCLLPRGHPSARHSAVDWSDPDWEQFPKFADAEVNEVVMQAGDVMYLPTHWFHYIISLELNYQCNTRSGITDHYLHSIEQCGF